jgi:hypothetical protein
MARGLSDAAIRNARPKAKRYRLSDGHGLSIEISPNSTPSEPKKFWRYRYRIDGRENLFAAGEWCRRGRAGLGTSLEASND